MINRYLKDVTSESEVMCSHNILQCPLVGLLQALLDSRGGGEEGCNASGCLDAETKVVVQHLQDGDISLWDTIDSQYFHNEG